MDLPADSAPAAEAEPIKRRNHFRAIDSVDIPGAMHELTIRAAYPLGGEEFFNSELNVIVELDWELRSKDKTPAGTYKGFSAYVLSRLNACKK